jgi:uncharacterized membrane-anchored protein
MSKNDNGNAIIVPLLLVTVVLSLLSGMLAWNWINPNSFGKGLLFLITWGFFSAISYNVAMAIVFIFMDKK